MASMRLPSIFIVIGTILLSACARISTLEAVPTQPAPLLPQLGSGVSHSCLLTLQGQVYCWGQGALVGQNTGPENFGKPFHVEGLDAISLGAGWYHTCAVVRDGHVKCWGQNTSGQLGDGTQKDSSIPVNVIHLEGARSVSAGAAYSCALTNAGEVYCWGQNTSGQLGNGTPTDSLTPVPVTGLSGPVANISAGSTFTCALMVKGGVECWGEFGFIPLDESEITPNPELVPGTQKIHTSAIVIPNLGEDVKQIGTGNYHLCVLRKSNEVECEGMIEAPDNPPFTKADENLDPLQGHIQQILAGTDFNCALTDGGKVYCWGTNDFDQLGNGTFLSSAEPVLVSIDKKVASLGGGYYTACALLADGSIKCWGDTSFGQLGDGTARWK